MTSAPTHDEASQRRVAAHLGRHRRVVEAAGARRQAAVAITLVPGPEGRTAFLLTRRSRGLSAHSGQYALPGGKIDPGETAEEAALRELREELGVAAGPGAFLGALDDLPTRAGFLITPFVLWLAAMPEIRPSPAEIAACHVVPVSDLFAGPGRGGNRADARGVELEPGVFSLYLESLGHDLFAPTAAILEHFREVAILGRSTPAPRFGEPRFASR